MGAFEVRRNGLCRLLVRGFLEEAIPRLRLDRYRPTALELGTGVGPGAFFLAARGFRVHAIDLIPEAITQAQLVASKRGMDVRFEVMDVTRIPRHGPGYDLIVDSYCLQGIVVDEDRQVVDRRTGRVFDGYDDDCLYDRDTDLCYWPYDGDVEIDGAITVNGARFFPARRYRNASRLRHEVASYGFEVLDQSGEWGENLVAVHRGSGVQLPQVRGRIAASGTSTDDQMDPIRLRRD